MSWHLQRVEAKKSYLRSDNYFSLRGQFSITTKGISMLVHSFQNSASLVREFPPRPCMVSRAATIHVGLTLITAVSVKRQDCSCMDLVPGPAILSETCWMGVTSNHFQTHHACTMLYQPTGFLSGDLNSGGSIQEVAVWPVRCSRISCLLARPWPKIAVITPST